MHCNVDNMMMMMNHGQMGHYHHFIRDLLKPPPDVKQGCCSHPVKIVINGASSNVKPMIREVVLFQGLFYNSFLKLFKRCRKQNNSTWLVVNTCHLPPADTPTTHCIKPVRGEHEVDGVASASYGRWQGGANTLASNRNIAIRG